jgi:hypothetical protein
VPDTTPIPDIPALTAVRYVQPLREGGSLPAVVETAEDGLFVVKFRGAGQGAKVLVAELIVGLLARAVGLPVPELALVEVSDRFGRSEPDPEIQELLRRSHGVNVGMRYLDGAFNYDGSAAGDLMDAGLAARIVWLDALVTNPDRTARNPNMLVWQRRPWLIDHGAALYAQHDWASVDEARTRTPFPLIERHVLLTHAGDIAAADAALAPLLDDAAIAHVVAQVPDALLDDPVSGGDFPSPDAARARYAGYLRTRLAGPRAWVEEAVRAQARRRALPPQRLEARR